MLDRPRVSRRRLLLAALQGAAAGTLLYAFRPNPSAAPTMAVLTSTLTSPPFPAAPKATLAPMTTLYVASQEAPGADGSRERPWSLVRALSGEVTPAYVRLALLETAYTLPDGAVIGLTQPGIQVVHIDQLPVTIALAGTLRWQAGAATWIGVTIRGM